MGESFRLMWHTARIALLCIIGFAAIVYLGDMAGVLDADRAEAQPRTEIEGIQ